MRIIYQTSQFKKDIKRLKKRGKDLGKLSKIIKDLIVGKPLEARFRDHTLTGEWSGSRDCHIEPDTLFLERSGSHSDVFK